MLHAQQSNFPHEVNKVFCILYPVCLIVILFTALYFIQWQSLSVGLWYVASPKKA